MIAPIPVAWERVVEYVLIVGLRVAVLRRCIV